jgi:putative protease
VDSLKIEGRTKSRYYVARTAQVYRRAIDDAVAGLPFNPELLAELDGLASRGYTAGLLTPQPMEHYQNYASGYPETDRGQWVAQVLDEQPPASAVGLHGDWVQVEAKNRFAVGDTLQVLHPGGNHTLTLQALRDARGQPVAVAQGSPLRLWVPLPAALAGALLVRVSGPAA